MITKESRSLLCFMIHLKNEIKICDAKSFRNYTLYEMYQFVFPIFFRVTLKLQVYARHFNNISKKNGFT